jgi:2-dehydro-3-deoxyphosphogluconate aldolase/(4S)-4-hydroxy-2-oxoglutarate aldolase
MYSNICRKGYYNAKSGPTKAPIAGHGRRPVWRPQPLPTVPLRARRPAHKWAAMPFIDDLARLGIISIIRSPSADIGVAIAAALFRGGVLGVEVTYSTPDCCAAIHRIVQGAPPGAAIGVGTVRTIAELEAALAAGATYAVCPHVDVELIAAARRLGMPILPGALTPTEVVTAWRAGATCIKLFPASQGGPEYLRALRAPLSDIPFMPTGGVSNQNMQAWFAAGALAVGMGGKLASGPPHEVEAAAREASGILAGIRAGR